MNIQYWYLPFAMFTETCDLAECKAPAQGKPNDSVTAGAVVPAPKVPTLSAPEVVFLSHYPPIPASAVIAQPRF